MIDSSAEPCCIGWVTSGGDDRCHEPDCPDRRPDVPREKSLLTHLRRPDLAVPICGAPFAAVTLDVTRVDCRDCWRLTADPRLKDA